MMNMMDQADRLRELLGLQWPPVAIAFRSTPPPGVPRIDSAGPAGCAYWKLAAEGKVFYTAASDHYNCPVGAHTHGIDLPPAQQAELQGVIGTMVQLQYLREAEISAIPRRTKPFGVAVYSPWSLAPDDPDVILVRGNAKQLMLLSEAVRAAGIGDAGELMGRPTCAMIPATLQSGRASTSLGCIGNRVYTALADDEFYAAVPWPKINDVLLQLPVLVNANRELEAYHRQRAASLSS